MAKKQPNAMPRDQIALEDLDCIKGTMRNLTQILVPAYHLTALVKIIVYSVETEPYFWNVEQS